MDDKLTFWLIPGPAFVEPSVLNPSGLNTGVNFGFRGHINNDQLFAYISYAHFVPRITIMVSLRNVSGVVHAGR
jgi:hypothetical protein